MDLKGEYVLLWSDGTVQRLPIGEARWTKGADREKYAHFPGEAGLPKKTTSVGELYKTDGLSQFNEIKVDGKAIGNR